MSLPHPQAPWWGGSGLADRALGSANHAGLAGSPKVTRRVVRRAGAAWHRRRAEALGSDVRFSSSSVRGWMQFQGAPSQGTGLSRESRGCRAFLGAALLGHGAVPSLAMGVASQEGLILTCHRHQFP